MVTDEAWPGLRSMQLGQCQVRELVRSDVFAVEDDGRVAVA